MTQQSAVLLVAFLAGLVVAAVLLRTATRDLLPRSAMVIAALAVPLWLFYFASSQGRFFLASKGFLSAMPDALWFGLTFGVFTAAFFLALGYVYGDARRRDMSAWAWVIAASFNPILLDSSFIFCSEGLYLGFAAHVASQFEGETHSALTADARRAPVSEAAELQFDICAEGRFSNLRIHVHFMHDLRHQLMLL